MRKTFALLLFLFLILPSYSNAAGEVDILWQAHTYTPPFYDGLPLWTHESRITFVAMPNVTGINPSSLIYRWSKDGTVLGTSSGIGKRSITFSGNILSLPIEIKVDIKRSENEPYLGSTTINLTPEMSKTLIYEDNPLYGLMSHKAVVGDFNLLEDEVSFTAIPLFASVSERSAPVMSYTWSTNTGDVRTGNKVTYRAPEGASGSSFISLKAENTRILQQPPQTSFLIKFDSTDNNLFGF